MWFLIDRRVNDDFAVERVFVNYREVGELRVPSVDFFFYPYDMAILGNMDLCKELCSSFGPAGARPSVRPSCVAKTSTLDILRSNFLSSLSYLPCIQAPLTPTTLYHFR